MSTLYGMKDTSTHISFQLLFTEVVVLLCLSLKKKKQKKLTPLTASAFTIVGTGSHYRVSVVELYSIVFMGFLIFVFNCSNLKVISK